jgi:uncharacterized protein YegP (UPF0339 family)
MNPITVEIYQASDGWRWRIQAANNKIIADSAEAYVELRDAQHGVEVIIQAIAHDSFVIKVTP